MLKALPQALLIEYDQVIEFLDAQRLSGQGVGWVDAHLLASAFFTHCTIWSIDKPMRRAAAALNLLA